MSHQCILIVLCLINHEPFVKPTFRVLFFYMVGERDREREREGAGCVSEGTGCEGILVDTTGGVRRVETTPVCMSAKVNSGGE